MTLDQLLIFQSLAQLGSLSKAAKIEQIAQSIISRKLAQLEFEWGDRLFHRTGRGVVLTEFGQRMQPYVELLLSQASQLREEVKNSSGVATGIVRIGVLQSLSRDLLAALFPDISKLAPLVRLHVTEGLSDQLDAQLITGHLDLVVVNRYGPLSIEEELLGQVESFVVGHPEASLLMGRNVNFRDLDGVRLVLPTRPSALRLVLDHSARHHGISLNSVLEVDSLSTRHMIAMGGDAFTISSFLGVDREVATGKLQALKLVNPGIKRSVILSITKQHPLSRAGRLVASRLRHLAPDLISRGVDRANSYSEIANGRNV